MPHHSWPHYGSERTCPTGRSFAPASLMRLKPKSRSYGKPQDPGTVAIEFEKGDRPNENSYTCGRPHVDLWPLWPECCLSYI
jgi:hypothetical protein